ncbi:hypothetical protein BDZ89DRAFT_1034266 [Hymenopellis radicata]|nr:hypothetical protein BDZ89DRAFT_1034266 [Hymenopellis radicata]
MISWISVLLLLTPQFASALKIELPESTIPGNETPVDLAHERGDRTDIYLFANCNIQLGSYRPSEATSVSTVIPSSASNPSFSGLGLGNSEQHPSLPIGAIIGIVVTVVVVLIGIAIFVLVMLRRSKRQANGQDQTVIDEHKERSRQSSPVDPEDIAPHTPTPLPTHRCTDSRETRERRADGQIVVCRSRAFMRL